MPSAATRLTEIAGRPRKAASRAAPTGGPDGGRVERDRAQVLAPVDARDDEVRRGREELLDGQTDARGRQRVDGEPLDAVPVLLPDGDGPI